MFGRETEKVLQTVLGSPLLLAGVVLIYFLPSLIAVRRGRKNTVAIVVLNLLLGWSFVGWVIALVWALAEVESRIGDQGNIFVVLDKPGALAFAIGFHVMVLSFLIVPIIVGLCTDWLTGLLSIIPYGIILHLFVWPTYFGARRHCAYCGKKLFIPIDATSWTKQQKRKCQKCGGIHSVTWDDGSLFRYFGFWEFFSR